VSANFPSGTVWTGDNLPILRGMNSGRVDLIYLNPPFNSNRTYEAPIGSRAAGASFKDAWTLDDVDVHEHGELADRNPAAHAVIAAARQAHGKGMMAYLIFMAVRLMEMHRGLKDTGSIYLHCDPTASHYLKLLLDGVFGKAAFRNEVVWKRQSAHSDARKFGRVSDRILFYTASQRRTWNPQYAPLSDAYVARDYRHTDSTGRYRVDNLTGPGLSDGESGQPWRGYDPGSSGRHWSVPKTGGYAAWLNANLIPGYARMAGVHERLEALAAAGLIDWTARGYPRLKRYLAASRGEAATDFIPDMPDPNNRSKEWLHYPTQKPLALLDRIITASSNTGDMVLDPFCGCATALVAADRLGRRWAGIDLSPLAVTLVNDRIVQDRGPLWGSVNALETPPVRTDLVPEGHRRPAFLMKLSKSKPTEGAF